MDEMNPLDVLKKFVIGEINAEAFEAILYADKALEKILSSNPPIPPYAKEGELFLFLISSSYTSSRAILNAQNALHKFLMTCGMEVEPSHEIQDRVAEKHRVLPKWLNIPDALYAEIRKGADELAGEEFIAFMKNQIKTRFVCLGKPPRWLQDQHWPVVEGEPAVFVGQLDISKMRHDTAHVYVFMAKNGQYITIEQSM
jgi:hypothetical protein